ncbi:MAG: SIMPL domain-containing protein [Candidatus Eremiobacteraeota bacterium]|nr:SIMPL domain-containing protein [Candidatus Eremiobacteraeota bacterium]
MPHRLAIALAALITVLPAASFAQTTASSPPNEATTAVITGQGAVSRAPDMATLNASIQTNDDVSANAASKNNAVLAALTTALGALHVDASDIKTTYYNVSFVPRPVQPPAQSATAVLQPAYPYPYQGRYGYVVNRQLSITVARVADVGAVVDAAVKAGVTNVNGVQYGLKDRKSATDAALALALEDAASQAKVVAAASHMRVGSIKQIQVGPSYGGGPMPVPMRSIANVIGTGVPTEITPTAVDVRATATVTYYLKP